MIFVRTLLLSTFLFLAACGFKPLYSSQTTAKQSFNAVFIDNIPDREGQYLRNALMDRLYNQGRPGTPQYNLNVSAIHQQRRDLDITKSSSATRAQLQVNTTITLSDSKTGSILLKRDLRALTSYNILQSQFTTRVSEDDAQRSALDDLARQIEQQLALHFNRN